MALVPETMFIFFASMNHKQSRRFDKFLAHVPPLRCGLEGLQVVLATGAKLAESRILLNSMNSVTDSPGLSLIKLDLGFLKLILTHTNSSTRIP